MAAANNGNKPRVWRSICFAAGHDTEGSHRHVCFDERLHDSVVMATQDSDSSFLVKVGFLKILRRYEITFTLPPPSEQPLHVKLLSVVPVPEGYSVKCKYSAHKEEGGAGACVSVAVQAGARGRHHGGSGAALEYDSQHSHWHGFD
uniref:Uncharacterized protein n=2 Tax=Pan TaxID=9596 RepID=A0A2I3RMP1_PANTR